MPNSTTERLVGISLDKAYGVKSKDALPETAKQNAAIWQAPFGAWRSRDLQEVTLHAGRLWLRNFDLSENNRLVIWDAQQTWSFCFLRATLPYQTHFTLGPLTDRVEANGIYIYDTGLQYIEFRI